MTENDKAEMEEVMNRLFSPSGTPAVLVVLENGEKLRTFTAMCPCCAADLLRQTADGLENSGISCRADEVLAVAFCVNTEN